MKLLKTIPSIRSACCAPLFFLLAAIGLLTIGSSCAQAQVPGTLYYGYYDGVVGDAGEWSTNSAYCSTNATSDSPLQGWVAGDYAYFGVTGITMPENMQVDPNGVDTPGITSANADSQGGLIQFSGGSITLDSDVAGGHPGYCTLKALNNMYFNTTLQGTNGLYIEGQSLSVQVVLDLANTYTGNTYVAESISFANGQAFGNGGTIMFEGGNAKANGGPYTVNNPVLLAANTQFGSEGGNFVFTGNVSLPNPVKCTVGNITVTFNGPISGNGALTAVNLANQTGILVLNSGNANSYTGLTTVNVNSGGTMTLDANTAGSLPGNVLVSGGTLQIDSPDAMSPSASLDINGGVVNGTYSGTQNIEALYIGGIMQPAGVYGPTNLNPGGVFTGSGSATFTVASGAATGIVITSPTNGATFAAPATITVDATAMTDTNTTPSIFFYVNGQVFATVTNPPYTAQVTLYLPQTATLTVGNSSGSIISAPVSVTITGTLPGGAPPAVPNLQVWFEANEGVSTNAIGGVTNWVDQVHHYNATATGGANPPVYIPTQPALNNLPSIQFNDGQWVQVQSNVDVAGDISEFAVMEVYTNTGSGSQQTIAEQTAAGYPEPNRWFIYNIAAPSVGANSSGDVWVQRGNGGTAAIDYAQYPSSSPVPTGRYILLGFSGSHNTNVPYSETVTNYLNGGDFGTISLNVSIAGGGFPMQIGGANGAPLLGEIAELMVYNTALSPSNVTAVWNYVTNKYKIDYTVPSIAIDGPTNLGIVDGPTNLTVTVPVTDPEGTLASVQLFMNGNLISTLTGPPYQFTVSLAGSGAVTLQAVATDTLGAYVDSEPVSLTLAASNTNYPAGTNLQLWLEANVGALTNSGGVYEWDDQSGNTNNAYLQGEGNPSTLVTNAINGQPSVHMLGANYNYFVVPNAPGLEITGDIATALVVQDNSTTDARFPWFMGGASGLPSPNGFIFLGGPPSLIRGNGTSGPAGLQEYDGSGANVVSGEYNIIVATQTGSTVTQYLDGGYVKTADFSLTFPTGIYDGEGNSPVYIGTRGDFYHFSYPYVPSDMAIAEIMIFNTGLNETNLANVQDYLAAKYGYILSSAVQIPVPTLSVTYQAGGSVLISWPETYSAYVLESTASLSSGSWTPVAGVVNNQVTVTPHGQEFYRLQYSP